MWKKNTSVKESEMFEKKKKVLSFFFQCIKSCYTIFFSVLKWVIQLPFMNVEMLKKEKKNNLFLYYERIKIYCLRSLAGAVCQRVCFILFLLSYQYQ